MSDIIYDFQRPLPRMCEWCHYPFNASYPGHISWIDCPEHRPGHMKYFDRAQRIIDEVLK